MGAGYDVRTNRKAWTTEDQLAAFVARKMHSYGIRYRHDLHHWFLLGRNVCCIRFRISCCIVDGLRLHIESALFFRITICRNGEGTGARNTCRWNRRRNSGNHLRAVFGMAGDWVTSKAIVDLKKKYNFRSPGWWCHGFGTMGKPAAGTGGISAVRTVLIVFSTFANQWLDWSIYSRYRGCDITPFL